MACGSWVPQPGIEPTPSALEAQSCIHWNTREHVSLPAEYGRLLDAWTVPGWLLKKNLSKLLL